MRNPRLDLLPKGTMFYRDSSRKMVSGVIAGLSEVCSFDVGVARAAFALFATFTPYFMGVLLYPLLAWILPDIAKPAQPSVEP